MSHRQSSIFMTPSPTPLALIVPHVCSQNLHLYLMFFFFTILFPNWSLVIINKIMIVSVIFTFFYFVFWVIRSSGAIYNVNLQLALISNPTPKYPLMSRRQSSIFMTHPSLSPGPICWLASFTCLSPEADPKCQRHQIAFVKSNLF